VTSSPSRGYPEQAGGATRILQPACSGRTGTVWRTFPMGWTINTKSRSWNEIAESMERQSRWRADYFEVKLPKRRAAMRRR